MNSLARHGIEVWKTKGAAGYLTYHNGISHTGHIEGDLTADDIKKEVNAVGVTELKCHYPRKE